MFFTLMTDLRRSYQNGAPRLTRNAVPKPVFCGKASFLLRSPEDLVPLATFENNLVTSRKDLEGL